MENCSLPSDALFLGFDCSTQSLKATVLDANLKIFATAVVNFDSELPHYKTKDGVYRDPLVNGRIVSPTLMWVEALDLIIQRLEMSKLDLGKIIAVSGSAQQHGSVYWKTGSSKVLASLDSKKPLVDQLGDVFSVTESPIWMDCSSTEQCRAIEKAVGGALELSKLTGSCAHERYAGPQIRKLFERQPEVYKSTERISLVSSFMASLLIGAHACIDHTDGAGMNLMDIELRGWSKKALEVFGISNDHKPSLQGHTFPDPVDADNYMVMLVYKNGSLTREDGKLGFYYKEHEILPPLPVGEHRYVLENFENDSLYGLKERRVNEFGAPSEVCSPRRVNEFDAVSEVCSPRKVHEFDAPSEVRALIEGQLLSMRAHAEKIGMPSPPRRIIATGGASSNKCILSLMASIFGCNVYTVQRPGKLQIPK
ncbi:UNVERIFIED_CONTAM: Xylulose kinase [Sesamum radiatum]|uniref:Xylulose kinase n=1 Tax=Sesamum radiatum TaxID=300843 RepID=A0AAW2Q0S2_SESRA